MESLKDEESKLATKDIKLPKGVEYADVDQDLELVVANVYEPSALEAANAAAAGEGEDAEDVASDNGGEETAEAEDTKKEDLELYRSVAFIKIGRWSDRPFGNVRTSVTIASE